MPFDLDDWISDVGADVVDRFYTPGVVLTDPERLVYEVWILDTECRNGGLSQYFGNRGIEQWQSLESVLEAAGFESFRPFAEKVRDLIAGAGDPFLAICHAGNEAEDLWYAYQRAVVAQVRERVGDAP